MEKDADQSEQATFATTNSTLNPTDSSLSNLNGPSRPETASKRKRSDMLLSQEETNAILSGLDPSQLQAIEDLMSDMDDVEKGQFIQ